MNWSRAAHLGNAVPAALCVQVAVGAEAVAKPRPKSVRIVYLVSADRSVREDFRKGIETAAKDLQGWYGRQLGGPTFRLNDPVVEVVKSDKEAKWFYSHPNGDNKDDWGFNNGLAEARRLVGARQGDPQYVWVIYSDGPGNQGARRRRSGRPARGRPSGTCRAAPHAEGRETVDRRVGTRVGARLRAGSSARHGEVCRRHHVDGDLREVS